jgi:two-component system sensor histidine kinase AtoS
MLVGEPGFGSYHEREQERFVAYAPVPKKGWVVGVSIERSDLMADVLAFRQRMLTLALGTLTLGIVAALGVVQWLVTPIGALTRGAAAIARGDWNQTISISRGDEIGQLASTFNRMARALRETTAHLIQRERLAALGELAAAIAHEVRNPLAALKTSLQVLARRLTGNEAGEFGADVQKEVDRLNALVASILDYARPAPAKPVPVAVPTILEQALALVGKSLDQHGIRFALEVERPLPRSLADPQQMEQVFLNLFLNAQKAMPDGGRLTVKCRTGSAECGMGNETGSVEVVVADTGKGIPAEVMPRIFDPFFTTDPQGTGLGLAVTHRLIHENGGSILVESSPEGGAVFTVRLPSAPEK